MITETLTTGWRPTCHHYDDDYRRDLPRARSERKRRQQDMAGRWWPRARRRPGKKTWPAVPSVVLDPFVGSGTTLQVARALGRHGIGLDLSFDYLSQQARSRLELDKLDAWHGRGNGAQSDINDLPLFKGVEP